MGAINDTIQTEVALIDSEETQAVRIATESLQRLKDKNITVFECPQCNEIYQQKRGSRLVKCGKCGWFAPPSEAEMARDVEMERRRERRVNRLKKKNG